MTEIKTEATTLAPPLKWAGGKRWLVPRLRELLQPFADRRLVEPFVGGMAVALGVRPQRALLNDVNPHLINFYHWIGAGVEAFFDIPMENNKDLYYRHRERFNHLIATNNQYTLESALLFYYLNRTGFNGLCRFNKSGYFNVPFGKYATINYIHDFSAYGDVLQEWNICNRDFADLILEPSDVIYADPPYDVEFTNYSAGGFTWIDQQRLAHWLAAHKGPVITSNQATPRIQALYTSLGFDIELLPAPRRIACNGNRDTALEILATRGLSC